MAEPVLARTVAPWAIAAGALGLALGLWLRPPPAAPAESPGWVSYADLYAGVAPVVVNVSLDQPEPRLGSGFAVAEDAVVTARHLVVGAERAVVRTSEGKVYEARVVGTDARTDLALLEVEGGELQPAALGRSEDLMIGDTVLAIGNPYGLGHSLAVGVLGSRGRRLDLGESEEGPRVDFLQLTIPLNPGNSGGPIFDSQGAVVGVLAGTHAQGQAIAFAVPVEVLQDALPELAAGAQVTRAFFGVRTEVRGDELVVSRVIPSGPGGRAGIREGDALVAVQGERVQTPDALRALLDRLPANEPVHVQVRRGAEHFHYPVRMGDWAVTPVVVAGMTLVAEPGSGGRVLAVRPRSRAERAGVAVEDIIRSVNGVPVQAPADVQELLQGEAAQVQVTRGGQPASVQFDWGGTPFAGPG